MTKKKQKMWKGRIGGFVGGAVLVALIGLGGIAVATDIFRIEAGFDVQTDNTINRLLNIAEQEVMGSPAFGGSTSDDWNVGGDLTVTGAVDFNGDTRIDNPILGAGQVDFGFFDDGAADNATATAAQMCNYSKWIFATDVPVTVGLPDATSTIADCIQTVGSCKTVRIENQSTTSAGTITFVAVDQRYDGFGATSMYFASSSEATVGDLQSATLTWCNDDGATTTLDIIPYWKDPR